MALANANAGAMAGASGKASGSAWLGQPWCQGKSKRQSMGQGHAKWWSRRVQPHDLPNATPMGGSMPLPAVLSDAGVSNTRASMELNMWKGTVAETRKRARSAVVWHELSKPKLTDSLCIIDLAWGPHRRVAQAGAPSRPRVLESKPFQVILAYLTDGERRQFIPGSLSVQAVNSKKATYNAHVAQTVMEASCSIACDEGGVSGPVCFGLRWGLALARLWPDSGQTLARLGPDSGQTRARPFVVPFMSVVHVLSIRSGDPSLAGVGGHLARPASSVEATRTHPRSFALTHGTHTKRN